MLAIGRGQRSVHPRASMESLLHEELAVIGRASAKVAALMKEVFNEAGGLKIPLSEVMSTAQYYANGDVALEGPFALERVLRVLPIIKSALGVRHRSFAEAVRGMSETAWAHCGPCRTRKLNPSCCLTLRSTAPRRSSGTFVSTPTGSCRTGRECLGTFAWLR
jgi:hypothetical protein